MGDCKKSSIAFSMSLPSLSSCTLNEALAEWGLLAVLVCLAAEAGRIDVTVEDILLNLIPVTSTLCGWLVGGDADGFGVAHTGGLHQPPLQEEACLAWNFLHHLRSSDSSVAVRGRWTALREQVEKQDPRTWYDAHSSISWPLTLVVGGLPQAESALMTGRFKAFMASLY